MARKCAGPGCKRVAGIRWAAGVVARRAAGLGGPGARQRRVARVVRDPAARRSTAADRPGDQLRDDHLRGRRRRPGSGPASRPRHRSGTCTASGPRRATASTGYPRHRGWRSRMTARALAAFGRRAVRPWSRATSSSIAAIRIACARRRVDRRSGRPGECRSACGLESTDAGTTFGATPLYDGARRTRTSSASRSRAATRRSSTSRMYTTPGPPPHAAALGRRRPHLGGPRHRGGARRQRIPHPDRRPRRSRRPLPARGRVGHGAVAVTRDGGATFAMPVTVTAVRRRAERVPAHGQRDGAGGGAVITIEGGGMNGVALSVDRRRPHLRPLDAVAAAAHSGPGRTRRRPLPRRQELQRRLGAGDVARRGGDHHSRCPATTTSAASSPARMSVCGDQCDLVACQAVWTNDVCTGALLDAGAAMSADATARQAAVARRECRARVGVRCLRWSWRSRSRVAAAAGAVADDARRYASAIARQSTARSVSLVFVLHTVLQTAYPYKAGPIAQRSELAAHNRLVPGSNPGGPTPLTWMDTASIREYVYETPRRNRNCAISLSDSRNCRDTTPRFRN